MKHHKSELYFLLALLIGVMILSFFIFKPFIFVALLAIFIATVFSPLYQKVLILTRGNRGVGALLTILLVVVIIIIPITFLVTQILKEATQLYQYLLSNEGASTFSISMNKALEKVGKFMPVPAGSSLDIHYYIKQGLDWLLPRLTTVVSDIARV